MEGAAAAGRLRHSPLAGGGAGRDAARAGFDRAPAYPRCAARPTFSVLDAVGNQSTALLPAYYTGRTQLGCQSHWYHFRTTWRVDRFCSRRKIDKFTAPVPVSSAIRDLSAIGVWLLCMRSGQLGVPARAHAGGAGDGQLVAGGRPGLRTAVRACSFSVLFLFSFLLFTVCLLDDLPVSHPALCDYR